MKFSKIDLNLYQILKQNRFSDCLAAILEAILNRNVIPLIRLLQQVDPLSTGLDKHFGI